MGGARRFGNMNTSAAEAVDVVLFETGEIREGLRVCGTVFFDNFELEFGPIANLVEFKGELAHWAARR
jgi:hypothetical protein